MNPHPIAKVFAPLVFLSLALLTLGFSFGPAHGQGPASATAAPRIERFDLDPPTRLVPGVYETAYTIRTGDRIEVDSVVTGNLRHGNQELSTVLAQPLVDNSPVAASR